MRIALDMEPAIGNIDGIGTYVKGLVQGLINTQNDLEIVPIYGCLPSAKEMWCPESSAIKKRTTLMPHRCYDYLINRGFPIELSSGFVDIVHWPNCSSWRSHKAKIVVTIHDLVFIERPDLYDEETLLHYNALMEYTFEHADHLIANSQHTANAISMHYDWPDSKISYVHLGGSEIANENIDGIKLPFDAQKYILAIGSHTIRKNYHTLVKAFAEVRDHTPDLKLVIIGKSTPNTQFLLDACSRLGLQDHIIWLGYASNELKAALIKSAACVVNTSWHEGFGIPLVEAMSCGTPVICSNVAACPEITDDAAILCDPADPSSFASAILRILTDNSTADILRTKGLNRSRIFTWEACAKGTRDIYEKVLLV